MELEAGKLKIEGDPFSVELERGQRGSYGWSIKVRGDDLVKLLDQLDVIDGALRVSYGPQESSIPAAPPDNKAEK